MNPSTQLRKVVFGSALMKANYFGILTASLLPFCVFGEPSIAVTLRPPGQPALKVRLSEPMVVGVATRPEEWGFFQFPTLARWSDGTVAASWQMAADSIVSYGSGASGGAISKDGGKTWTRLTGEKGISGFLLPNGDRLQVVTPKAIKTSELRLPTSVSQIETYDKVKQTLYRLSELPPEVQGVCLSRLPSGKTEWVTERASLDDPQALRYSLSDLFPIVWWGDMHLAADGSLLAGIYPGLRLKDDGSVDPKGGVFFYRSSDAGHSWHIQGRIPYQPDLVADPKGAQRQGFTEPAFEILADGSFLCVTRSDGPMYASRSQNLGRTWSRPEVIAGNGVLPRLLRLTNGVVALSSGRPGVQLRFCADGRGKAWTQPIELVPSMNEKDTVSSGSAPASWYATQVSCGYTFLLATGPDRFLIIYSDFKYKNAAGEIRKAIKVREVIVIPQDQGVGS